MTLPITAKAAVSKEDFLEVSKEFIDFIIPFGQRWNPSYTRSIKLVADPKFGAFASEPISVNQGLLDDPSMTKDTLALVLCHEVGHDVGLARFALGGKLHYAFSHLEQDYFAVRACLFPYFDTTEPVFSGTVTEPEMIPKTIYTRCHTDFEGKNGARDCMRAIRASQKLSDGLYEFFQSFSPNHKFPRPSLTRTWLGSGDELQARLENFINGIFDDSPFNKK